MTNDPMKVFNIRDLVTEAVYQEFLRVPALSLGLYNHVAGAAVPQDPCFILRSSEGVAVRHAIPRYPAKLELQ
jgi:hypothetical protein